MSVSCMAISCTASTSSIFLGRVRSRRMIGVKVSQDERKGGSVRVGINQFINSINYIRFLVASCNQYQSREISKTLEPEYACLARATLLMTTHPLIWDESTTKMNTRTCCPRPVILLN